MKYIQIKSESEINLKGIKSELVFRDSLLKSVILTDIDGNTLTIDEKSTYESLGVYIPKEPEKKRRVQIDRLDFERDKSR